MFQNILLELILLFYLLPNQTLFIRDIIFLFIKVAKDFLKNLSFSCWRETKRILDILFFAID